VTLSRLQVLFLMTSFPRTEGDVATPWAVELIQRLAGRGVQVTVCAPSYRGLRDHQVRGIPVMRFRYAPAAIEMLTHDSGATNKLRRNPLYAALLPGYLLAGSQRVRQLCREQRWDVVHIHWPMPQGILALIGCPAGGPRLVSTFYGADLALVRNLPLLKPLLRRIVARSDAISAISAYTASELTRMSGARPAIIPYGIDMTPLTAQDVGPKPAPVEILTVGRLIERKGHAVLIDAMAHIARSRPDAVLTVIGEGHERPSLERRIEQLGLQAQVRLLGRVSEEELHRAYARCDIFVLPSIVDRAGDTEGLGMVLLEAMRYEKPTVASALGGITDIIEDGTTGLLVPPGDPVALANAIERLLNAPALARQLGQAGRRINAERFAWDRVVDAYMGLYQP